jgi:hypothetical protein
LCFGKAKVVNDCRIPSLDLAHNARHGAFLRAPPVDRFNGFVGKVNAFERFENMIDKTSAALLAVGQKIETDLFLSPHVEACSVVLGFFESGTLEPKAYSTAICGPQPTWPWKTANGGCGDGRELHSVTSEDFSLPIYAPMEKDKLPFQG